MESRFVFSAGLVLCCLLIVQFPVQTNADVNGGTTCAGCTIILSLVDQIAEIHNESAVDALTRLCGYLPDQFQAACKGFLDFATPVLLDLILEKYNADVACNALKLCYTDPGQRECRLYPNPNSGGMRAVLKSLYLSKKVSKQTKLIMMGKGVGLTSDICDSLPGLNGLCEWLEHIHINNHTAVSDIDKDEFGITPTLRGSHWRGKDCDDFDKTIYPGRRPKNNDAENDSDCNGIFGINPATGNSFEEDFCGADSDHRGVILLSDSAGAHFHIPAEWLTASKLSLDVFKHVLMVVEDEFDWPELSGTTGYMNTTWDIIHGPTDSLYYKLLQRNRCNHRDFQNIGVNGADVGSMNNSIQYSMSRDPATDHPAIVMYSLIGNDVCNGHPDTIEHMTTVPQMKANSLSTLKYLDTRLPKNSFVIISGMADGHVLYELMANRIHPLGQFRQDITYKHVYDLLSCLQVSPCNGWMSSNATLRNFTSERAANLSKALQEVTKDNTFSNFKTYYIDFDIRAVIKEWEDMGGEGWQMIEPVDGFHPSQNANFMTARHLWKELEKSYPEILGKVNPHNEAIRKQFGDQGGY